MRRPVVTWEQEWVDGLLVDVVDPALYTVLPEVGQLRKCADEAMAAAVVLRPNVDVFGALGRVHPDELSDAGLVDALTATERLKAAVEAVQIELLAELKRRDPSGEEYLQDEVGCALKLAPGTAAERIEVAQQLQGRLRDTWECLRDGQLGAVHGKILATACRELCDEVTAKVQARVLRRACSQTPGEFRAAVRRAVAACDTKSQADRHTAAVTRRRAVVEHVDDGMSWINLFLPRDGAEIIWTAIGARAVRTDRTDRRTADQRRADAAVEIAQAALANPDLISQHGLRPSVNITLAASTLAELDEQPGLVNGEPVPAAVARRFATSPDARRHHWPVDIDGRLLDNKPTGSSQTGTRSVRTDPAGPLRTDSYTPTARIARHVITRDQHCVMPGCRRSAYRCELDHRVPWPAGDTSAQNLQPLCKRHHDLKHRSGWTITRSPDGSYLWTSRTRHRYRYRPPELPAPEQPPPTDNDPPPF